MFSAALCRSLIEAWRPPSGCRSTRSFSAALCRSLIEACGCRAGPVSLPLFSAALCRSLIEAAPGSSLLLWSWPRFLRLYAAASLKLRGPGRSGHHQPEGFLRLYAAASLKPGHDDPEVLHILRFLRLYAAASLKLDVPDRIVVDLQPVFCGFMPQPH